MLTKSLLLTQGMRRKTRHGSPIALHCIDCRPFPILTMHRKLCLDWYSLSAKSGKTVITFKPKKQFKKILQDLECLKAVLHSLFYD